MKGGAVLILAGVWVLAQIFAGSALRRLGISGSSTQPGNSSATPPPSGGTGQGGGSGGGPGGGGGGSF